jgi:hypothetical protein
MPVTVAAIAAIVKAADPLEKLPSDIARTVGAKAIMDDVHDLHENTSTPQDLEKLAKRIVASVKQAKELLLAAKRLEDAEKAITFANSKVKSLCKQEFINKLVSIQLAGTGEKGHGKVPFLDDALHAHVTNTHSVAWNWVSGRVHVVAVGKKNNQNKVQDGKKTMEYDWTTK